MLYHEQSEDYRPLFWMGGRPVYANTLIVALHVAAFVMAAICISFLKPETVERSLMLSTPEVWRGEVWRLFSYIAFDPYFFSQRSLWFLFSIALLYFCGREVEQFAGRKTYLKLYAALVFVPAILFCLLGLLMVPAPFLNCCDVFFGMFIAFATIYPGAMPSLWISLPVSAIAWILLGVFTLINFAFHDYTALFMLWTSSAVGYGVMRLAGAGRGLNWLTDWIEEGRARRLARKHNIKVLKDTQAAESIDQILEKISKQGVGSLDARERAALERARANLLKRDQR
jgi:membrane associated rhomboid family serine protease